MPPSDPVTAEVLAHLVSDFVRGFGVLAEDRTPCGQPLSPREAHALLTLLGYEQTGDRIHQGQLQRHLGIDKSNVTRLVRRLSEAGRVEQLTQEDDARCRWLRLTPRGRKLATTLEQARAQHFTRLLAAIAPADRSRVAEALAILNHAVRQLTPEGA